MARPQQSHVAPEFYNAFKESLELSRRVFGNTTGLQFIITGSGTIGMETAVVSLLEAGDKILAVETGYFGQRFATLAEIHGCKVESIKTDLGKKVDPDVLRKKLKANQFKAVLFTHIDTSTSVMNDVLEISKIAKDNDALVVCDSVCGVGGAPLVFDTLGADVVLTGSQKAIAAPPGAALLAVSMRAMEIMDTRKTPIRSYYMNLLRWKPVMDDPKIYLCTPAVQVILGLHEALLQIKEEGLENRWRRHALISEAIRAGLESLDLLLVPDAASRSPTVTAFYVPDGRAGEVQEILRSDYGIHLARGFGEFKDTMLRIGHFGNISPSDALAFLGSLELVLSKRQGPGTRKAIESALPILHSG